MNIQFFKKINIGIMILAFALSGCKSEEADEPIIMVDNHEDAPTYNMDEVSKGDVILTQKVSCKYVQTEDQQISFQTGGRLVDKVYVKVGDHVKAGDLLLTMESGNLLDDIATLEYQIARNTLLLGYLDKAEEFAKQSEEYTYIYEYYSPESEVEINNHNHKIYLIEEDYQNQRDDYNDNIKYDTEKLIKLKNEYEENHVYATMSGKVADIKADLEGSVARKDDVIMSIVDNDSGLFEIDDKNAASYFKDGESVPMNIIYGTGKGDYELKPHNMSSWGEVPVFEIVDSPESATLEVGASGTINVTVEKKENVLRIPVKALYDADGKYYTYVLNENNMREARFIDVGLIGDSYAEVLKGIDMGMKVVCR